MDFLAKYMGYFSNNFRSGLGTMEFQDTGFRFQDNGIEKDVLKLDGTWFGGKSIAGDKITNIEYDYSAPTSYTYFSQYRLLKRFKRV